MPPLGPAPAVACCGPPPPMDRDRMRLHSHGDAHVPLPHLPVKPRGSSDGVENCLRTLDSVCFWLVLVVQYCPSTLLAPQATPSCNPPAPKQMIRWVRGSGCSYGTIRRGLEPGGFFFQRQHCLRVVWVARPGGLSGGAIRHDPREATFGTTSLDAVHAWPPSPVGGPQVGDSETALGCSGAWLDAWKTPGGRQVVMGEHCLSTDCAVTCPATPPAPLPHLPSRQHPHPTPRGA